MTHNEIYKFFTTLFPMYSNLIKIWFPNGKGSIRIRLQDIPEDFIFTYLNKKEWQFETVHYYINKLREDKKK